MATADLSPYGALGGLSILARPGANGVLMFEANSEVCGYATQALYYAGWVTFRYSAAYGDIGWTALPHVVVAHGLWVPKWVGAAVAHLYDFCNRSYGEALNRLAAHWARCAADTRAQAPAVWALGGGRAVDEWLAAHAGEAVCATSTG